MWHIEITRLPNMYTVELKDERHITVDQRNFPFQQWEAENNAHLQALIFANGLERGMKAAEVETSVYHNTPLD